MNSSEVTLDDRHPIGRQGPGLIRADGRGVAHGLAGVEMTHEIIILQHLLHGERQRYGNGKGKSLGDGDDQHGDPNDDEMKDLGEIDAGVPATSFNCILLD